MNPVISDLDLSSPARRTEFSALLDRAFGAPTDPGYLGCFPVWGVIPGDAAGVRRFAVIENGRIASTAAVRLATLRAPKGPLKVAIIGAVATDPAFSGRGLASALVEHAVGEAGRSGAALACLWGNQHALYRRLGFELCGVQARTGLADVLGARKGDEAAAARDVSIETGWDPAIFDLLMARRDGLALTKADQEWYSRHRGVEWFRLARGAKPAAYAGYGRGIDLQGIIHEWGGETEPLVALLRGVLARNPAAQLIGPVDRVQALAGRLDPTWLEYLCMARVLDPAELVRACAPGLPFSATRSGDFWDVTVGDASAQGLPDPDLSKLLFGPEPVRDLASEELPLPLWFWGLDSA